MQLQPNEVNALTYLHYDLDPEFPVSLFKHFHSPKSSIEASHYHHCLEIGYCYAGEGLFFIENNVYSFSKSDVSIIFPNQVHIAQSAQENKSNWRFLLIDPEKLLQSCFSEYLQEIVLGSKGTGSFKNILTRETQAQVVDIVFLLFEILLGEEKNAKMATKGLVLALLAKTSSILVQSGFANTHENVSNLGPGLILKILPALNYIVINYADEISTQYLAQLCNTSVTSFRRNFQGAMKLSPMEYLIKTRIQMSCVLLVSTDNTILEIAMMTGHISISSFNRHFLKIAGMSPREWRRAKKV